METYTPAEVAARLGVPDRTLRYWSTRFARYLSPTAVVARRGKGHTHRRFSEADIEVLRRVKWLAAQKVPLSQIEATLGQTFNTNQRTAEEDDTLLRTMRPSSPSQRTLSQAGPRKRSPGDTFGLSRDSAPSSSSDHQGLLTAHNSTYPTAGPKTNSNPTSAITSSHLSLPLTDKPSPSPSNLSEHADTPASTKQSSSLSSGQDGMIRIADHIMAEQRHIEERLEDLARQIADCTRAVADLQDRVAAIEASQREKTASSTLKGMSLPWPLSLLARRSLPRRDPWARRIALLMAERMLTRHELADRAGVDLNDLNRFLAGHMASPSSDFLDALARALNTGVNSRSEGSSPG